MKRRGFVACLAIQLPTKKEPSWWMMIIMDDAEEESSLEEEPSRPTHIRSLFAHHVPNSDMLRCDLDPFLL